MYSVYSTGECCAPEWLIYLYIDLFCTLVQAYTSLLASHDGDVYIAHPGVRHKRALLRLFNKITSDPTHPTWQDLPQYFVAVPGPGNHQFDQLPLWKKWNFRIIIVSWDMLDVWNPFQCPARGKLSLVGKERTLLACFRTEMGRCKPDFWQCKWELTPDKSCDCGVDVQTTRAC